MIGQNFPVTESLRSHIRNARTISRAGNWWTAVLLVDDPWTGKPFVSLYKWQRRQGAWKKTSSFKIHSAKHLAAIVESLSELGLQLGE